MRYHKTLFMACNRHGQNHETNAKERAMVGRCVCILMVLSSNDELLLGLKAHSAVQRSQLSSRNDYIETCTEHQSSLFMEDGLRGAGRAS